MKHSDLVVLADAMTPAIRAFVEKSAAALATRIEALEARQAELEAKAMKGRTR